MKVWGKFVSGIFVSMFLLGCVARADAMVIINEILADPPSGSAGDANRDGATSTSADEFVELYNPGADAVDLSGWSLADDVKLRHLFSPSTIIPSSSFLVVFGGGAPAITAPWQVASSGTLSLNNGGDVVKLYNAQGELVTQVQYGVEGDKGQSLVREVEGTPSAFVLHSQLANAQGQLFSPGYSMNPLVQENPETPRSVIPEIPTLGYLLTGLSFLWPRRGRRV